MSSDPTSAELAVVAGMLAGEGASNEAIAGQFARAAVLIGQAEAWLADGARRERETYAYIVALAEAADAADPVLPWSSERLHAIAGYSIDRGKTAEARGKKLRDSFRKGLQKYFPAAYADSWPKFRDGIDEGRFRKVWPMLSKWRSEKSR